MGALCRGDVFVGMEYEWSYLPLKWRIGQGAVTALSLYPLFKLASSYWAISYVIV